MKILIPFILLVVSSCKRKTTCIEDFDLSSFKLTEQKKVGEFNLKKYSSSCLFFIEEFYLNNSLSKSYYIDFDLKLQGEYKLFHKNGKLYQYSYFRNGVIDGVKILYDSLGIEYLRFQFKKGVLINEK